jgi:hypothetical protein
VIKSEYLEELRDEVRTETEMAALRKAVLRLGRLRFRKAAGRKHKGQLEAITDVAHLERIHDRLLDAASWEDLLTTA